MRAGAPLSVGTGIGKAQPEERRRQAWPLVLGRSLSLSPRPISRNLRRPAVRVEGVANQPDEQRVKLVATSRVRDWDRNPEREHEC